jgi:hypothetical protein
MTMPKSVTVSSSSDSVSTVGLEEGAGVATAEGAAASPRGADSVAGIFAGGLARATGMLSLFERDLLLFFFFFVLGNSTTEAGLVASDLEEFDGVSSISSGRLGGGADVGGDLGMGEAGIVCEVAVALFAFDAHPGAPSDGMTVKLLPHFGQLALVPRADSGAFTPPA